MTTTVDRRPETGHHADTPVEDNLLRQFLHNQGDANAMVAGAHGGRSHHGEGVLLADAASPVPFYNQALLTRPITDLDDPVLDEIEAFFADGRTACTLLSIWPTPDLARRGWGLWGHPMFTVRSPGAVPDDVPPGVETGVVGTPGGLEVVERIAIEGYPMPGAAGRPPGSIIPASLLGSPMTFRLGFVDGEPVTAVANHVAHGVVNLCLAATLPAARRRGVWQRLVWDRVGDAPDLPAVAFTSDDSRPGFVRMGFLPITRFTLWGR